MMHGLLDYLDIKNICHAVSGVLMVQKNETREYVKKISITVIAAGIMAALGGAASQFLSNRDQDILIQQNRILIEDSKTLIAQNKQENKEQNNRIEDQFSYLRNRIDDMNKSINELNRLMK